MHYKITLFSKKLESPNVLSCSDCVFYCHAQQHRPSMFKKVNPLFTAPHLPLRASLLIGWDTFIHAYYTNLKRLYNVHNCVHSILLSDFCQLFKRCAHIYMNSIN